MRGLEGSNCFKKIFMFFSFVYFFHRVFEAKVDWSVQKLRGRPVNPFLDAIASQEIHIYRSLTYLITYFTYLLTYLLTQSQS